MPSENLLDALRSRPLLCDGAMGTQLMAAGLLPGVCGETWNIDHPEKVQAVHAAYRQAGCDLLTTNTFGGNPLCLAKHGLEDQQARLNTAAAQIARQAAGEDAWVLGDLGPFGDFLEPLGATSAKTAQDAFARQAEALRQGGADAIIVETMTDPQELTLAIQSAKSITDWPVLATCAMDRGHSGTYHTMMGTTIQQAVQTALDAGADVVGINCGTSLELDDYLTLAQQIMDAAGQNPVIIQPNAGAPISQNGQEVYPASPSDMAHLAQKLINLGVRVIGGCCGTSPEHLHAMCQVIHCV